MKDIQAQREHNPASDRALFGPGWFYLFINPARKTPGFSRGDRRAVPYGA